MVVDRRDFTVPDELADLLDRLGFEGDHLDGHRRHRAAAAAGTAGAFRRAASARGGDREHQTKRRVNETPREAPQR